MPCRPPARRHIPSVFRRRERRRLLETAARVAAKHNRARVQRALRPVYMEFPEDES